MSRTINSEQDTNNVSSAASSASIASSFSIPRSNLNNPHFDRTLGAVTYRTSNAHQSLTASEQETANANHESLESTSTDQRLTSPALFQGFDSTPSPYLRSIVEAAERIARAPLVHVAGAGWIQSERAVTLNTAEYERPGGASGRLGLTRNYAGRPHVPGEDSGSESEEGSGDERGETMDWPEVRAEGGNHVRRSPRLSIPRAAQELSAEREWIRRHQATLRPRPRSRSRSRSHTSPRLWIEASATAPDTAPASTSIRTVDRLGSQTEPSSSVTARNETREVPAADAIETGAPQPLGDLDTSSGAVHSVVERTGQARRDLERALRDYRIARRILRTQTQNDTITAGAESRRGAGEAVQNTRQPLNDRALPSWEVSILMAPNAGTSRINEGGSRGSSTAFSTLPQNVDGVVEEHRQEREFIRNWVRNRSNTTRAYQPQDSSSNSQQNDDAVAVGPLFARDRTTASDLTVGTNGSSSGSSSSELFYAERERYRRLIHPPKDGEKSEDVSSTAAGQIARQKMQYLSSLKNLRGDKAAAWEMTKLLKIDNVLAPLDNDAAPEELPYSVEDLPNPARSSWLEAGMSWKGIQYPGAMDDGAKMLYARAIRHRERIRQEREEQRDIDTTFQQIERISLLPDRELLERSLLANRSHTLRSWTESMQVLEDAERQLSSILIGREQSLGHDDGWGTSAGIDGDRARLPLNAISRESRLGRRADELALRKAVEKNREHWPAKVSLHSVDWDKKVLFGTMSASQIHVLPEVETQETLHPDSNAPSIGRPSVSGKTTDSFFYGEIVDFRNFDLETIPAASADSMKPSTGRAIKTEWKVGGISTDIKYWAGIGPFRLEVEKALEDRRSSKGTFQGAGKFSTEVLDEEEKDEVRDEVMARRIGDKNWLNNVLGKDWILMRWKEQCFVTSDPGPNPPTPAPSRTASSYYRNHIWTTTYPSSAPPNSNSIPTTSPLNLGLTISGFYYVALHRQSGRLEGLYYDPDSQPFQKLRMIPADGYDAWNKDGDNGLETLLTDRSDAVGGVGNAVGKCPFGIKKTFPLVELR